MTSETGTAAIVRRRGLGRKQKRLAIIAGIGLVLAIALALILTALSGQMVYFYTPSEALAKHVPAGQFFRVGGMVEDGTWQQQGETNTFVLDDGHGQMTVQFTGILPDLFREGQGIVAEGALNQNGTFMATNVLAKHDENYIPKQIVDEMKKRGDWRPDDPQAALRQMQ